MIKHLRQKHPTGCGAACLAMLLDISYEEARKILPGHTTCWDMGQVIPATFPEGFTMLLVGDSERQHWIVQYLGKYYDPAFDKPTSKMNKRYAGVLAVVAGMI